MKTRNGFVSNSSSSSFIVLISAPSLAEEELIKRSSDYWEEHLGIAGCEEQELGNYYTKKIDAWAKEGKHVLLINRVNYGAEESVEELAKGLLEALDVDCSSVSFAWSE